MNDILGVGMTLTDLRGIGLGALVTLTIISIFRGWLVPKPFYDEVKHRAEQERLAKEKALEASRSLLEQNTMLLRREDQAHAALQAIRDRVAESKQVSP
ncbi:MAG TPA: hypothetical protein VFV76_14360 [Actinomycetes bacterium]|nr:hypothetical protein [Actinomycetes bacterium]